MTTASARRRPDALTWAERTILAALSLAAEQGRPCPTNLDLEELCGYNSCSMGPVLVRRLEQRGLIRVERTQKYRIVEIVATGLKTARSKSMHSDRIHVPKGTHRADRLAVAA